MTRTLEIIFLELRESFWMALAALRVNKLRSALTLLGIAVGVFSIIGVMTAMGVLLGSIESGMSALGAHTFQIQRYPMFHSGSPSEQAKLRNRKKLTYAEGERLKGTVTLAAQVGMFCSDFGKVVASRKGEKTNPNVSLSGRDIEGFMANSWTIEDGRLYTQDELNEGRHVAVMGMDVAKKLFPRVDPLGEIIRIDGQEYKVIGIVKPQGGMLGSGGDNFVVIPLTTYFQTYGKDQDIAIKVQSSTAEDYDDCVDQTRGLLRAARHVKPGDDDDFYIWSNDSLIDEFNNLTKYVRLGIVIVSAIALVAAGVGIMNIMLVSVTERTREIGIRKAVGARRNNILAQFILEAVVISQLGGVIGILAGLVGGNLLAVFMDVPPAVPFDWVAIGYASCTAVGVLFGVYPAWKAAGLDPIESLRYE